MADKTGIAWTARTAGIAFYLAAYLAAVWIVTTFGLSSTVIALLLSVLVVTLAIANIVVFTDGVVLSKGQAFRRWWWDLAMYSVLLLVFAAYIRIGDNPWAHWDTFFAMIKMPAFSTVVFLFFMTYGLSAFMLVWEGFYSVIDARHFVGWSTWAAYVARSLLRAILIGLAIIALVFFPHDRSWPIQIEARMAHLAREVGARGIPPTVRPILRQIADGRPVFVTDLTLAEMRLSRVARARRRALRRQRAHAAGVRSIRQTRKSLARLVGSERHILPAAGSVK